MKVEQRTGAAFSGYVEDTCTILDYVATHDAKVIAIADDHGERTVFFQARTPGGLDQLLDDLGAHGFKTARSDRVTT